MKNAVPKNVRIPVERRNPPMRGPTIIVIEPIDPRIPLTPPASLLSV